MRTCIFVFSYKCVTKCVFCGNTMTAIIQDESRPACLCQARLCSSVCAPSDTSVGLASTAIRSGGFYCSTCESRGLGRRIHGSVEDTKLSTNKQHSLSHLIMRLWAHRSRGLGWRIHESVEDTKLSTNKQHTLSRSRGA